MKRLFAFYVIAVAFFYYNLVPGVSGTRLPYVVGLAIVLGAALRTWHEGVVPRPGPFALVLLFFFIWTLANGFVVWMRDPIALVWYGRSEFQFMLMAGIVFAFAQARLNPSEVSKLSRIWVWTAGAAAAYAIYQGFARVLYLPQPEKLLVKWKFTTMIFKEYYGFTAVSSWFGEPTWLGSFLVVPLVYLVGVLVLDPPEPYRLPRRWTQVLIALILLALFLSLSQAAYITILVVAIPLIWSLRSRIVVGRALRFISLAFVLLLVPALILSTLGADIMQAQTKRLFALIDAWRTPESAWWISSYGPRMINMKAGVDIWLTSPIIGVGINTVPYHRYAQRLLIDPWSGAVDSGLLQLLVEQGVVGFIALMLALVILLERLRRAQATLTDPGHRFLAWFLMWALVTEIVNSISTYPWQHAQHWLLIGLSVAFLGYVDRQRAVAATPLASSRSSPA